MNIFLAISLLGVVISLTGLGICRRLDRIAEAIEAKLKEKNT